MVQVSEAQEEVDIVGLRKMVESSVGSVAWVGVSVYRSEKRLGRPKMAVLLLAMGSSEAFKVVLNILFGSF
jgi:hypothetical protein